MTLDMDIGPTTRIWVGLDGDGKYGERGQITPMWSVTRAERLPVGKRGVVFGGGGGSRRVCGKGRQ